MSKMKKRSKRICIFVLAIFILGFVASIGILTLSVFKNNLIYDYSLGSIVMNRVANAQYLPSSSNISDMETVNVNYAEGEIIENDPNFTLSDYNELIDSMGMIVTDDQYGVDGGFSHINTVKDEIYNMIAAVPAFDKWFSEAVGWQKLFRGQSYYIHYDEATERISITCISLSTDTALYDFEKDKINDGVLSGYLNPELKQIMQIEYYYNEDGKEVVEMNIYNTIVYKNKTYPVAYQYFKNVKDTSFTKIYILSNNRARPTEYYSNSDISSSPGTHDLKNYNEYGTLRSFTNLNYASEDNINLLAIDQFIPDRYYSAPECVSVRLYNKSKDDVIYYNTVYDYATEESINLPVYYENETHDLYFNDYSRSYNNLTNVFNYTQGKSMYSNATSVCKECFDNTNRKMLSCDHYTSSETVQRQLYESNNVDNSGLTIYQALSQNVYDLANNMGTKTDNAKLLTDNSYVLGTMSYENVFDDFLDEISIKFIDNFILRGNAEDILSAGKKSEMITDKNSVSSSIAVLSPSDTVCSGTIEDGIINYKIKGNMEPSMLLNNGNEYSLSLILSDGNYSYVLGNSYVVYDGTKMEFDYEGTYDFEDLIIKINGNYKLSVALTGKIKGKEYILSSVAPIELLYQNYVKADTVNDYHTKYEFSMTEDWLFVKAEVVDIAAPNLIFEGNDNTITFEYTPYAGEIINSYTYYDNELIVIIEIYNQNNEKISLFSRISSGLYTVKMADAAGNIAIDTVNVIVNI